MSQQLAAPAIDLPDVNVWLALSVRDHPHHTRALRYWNAQAAAQAGFCQVTLLGLVRLLCQPRVMGTSALDSAAALGVWQRWRQLPEVTLLETAAGWEQGFIALAGAGLPPRLLTDAYLAAVALHGGFRLVSFDADFHRFEGLNFLHLTADHSPAPSPT
jgi:toxin-antitoxin system PIN domain toxin